MHEWDAGREEQKDVAARHIEFCLQILDISGSALLL